MRSAYRNYLLALLLFGSNGIVAGQIPLPSESIVLLRTLLGSVTLLLFFLFTKGRFTFYHHPKHAFYLFLSGVALGMGWMFLYEAYRRVGVGVASLLYYCGPVLVMALSPLLFGEKFTPGRIAGFGIVLLGLMLISGRTVQTEQSIWGIVLGGMSAVFYAVMVIFNKKAYSIQGLENAVLQLSAGFLCVALWALFRRDAFPFVSAESLPFVLLLGLGNTGLGCFLYFSSIGSLPVQTVSIWGYLEPLSAVILSAVFLGERLSTVQILGALLIVGGAVLSQFLPHRRPHSRSGKRECSIRS